MKILLIASHVPPLVGGAPVVYWNLCRHLKDEIVVLAPWRFYKDGCEFKGWMEADSREPFEIRRIELLRPPIKPDPVSPLVSAWRLIFEDLPLRRRIARMALRLVDTTDANVICLGDLYDLSWLGEYLRRKREVSVVHYIHGEEITTVFGSRLYGRRSIDALRKAEAVIAVSSFTRDELIHRKVRPDRIHVITNGVNLDQFSPGAKDPGILARHGIAEKKVLLTVARVEERKGHDKVIEALPQMLAALPDVVYLVVGEGPYLECVKALVKNLGLEDKVIFAGRVPWADIPRYYRSCDVFIMPNRTLSNGNTEGFGLVFLEANACGKPAIGGKAGGVPDAIVDGETGILVDGNSVEQITHAAIQLLSNEKMAGRMGHAGYTRALTCSWADKAQEFRKVCRSLVK